MQNNYKDLTKESIEEHIIEALYGKQEKVNKQRIIKIWFFGTQEQFNELFHEPLKKAFNERLTLTDLK